VSLKHIGVLTVVAIATIGLVACAGDDDDSSSGSPTTNGRANGDVAVVTPSDFTADFSAMARLKDVAAKGKGKIAVLLPDTQSSARYVEFDAPFLKKAFKAAGLTADDYTIQNAQGSTRTMQTQAEAAIANGARVLIIDPLDAGIGAAIEKNAKDNGVVTIDYDRLTANGSSSYYVSFDNTNVGELIGQGMVDCVDAWKVGKPQVLIMNGDPSDNDAKSFSAGYHSVLDPKFEDRTYTKVAEPAGTWDEQKALTLFQQQYTAHSGINAVVAPSDGVANSVISGLKTVNVPPKKVPVTGHEATLQGLQNILAGYQCMTVYKPVYLEAQAAAALAIYLNAGEKPPAELVNAKTNNGTTDVPSVYLTAVSVTADNMADTVVKDKAVKAADLCAGPFDELCADAGITG
jgi:D-xylose transport system substrate-binding protein